VTEPVSAEPTDPYGLAKERARDLSAEVEARLDAVPVGDGDAFRTEVRAVVDALVAENESLADGLAGVVKFSNAVRGALGAALGKRVERMPGLEALALLISEWDELRADLDRERASRRDWMAEAMRLDVLVEEQHGLNADWVRYRDRVVAQRREWRGELAKALGIDVTDGLPHMFPLIAKVGVLRTRLIESARRGAAIQHDLDDTLSRLHAVRVEQHTLRAEHDRVRAENRRLASDNLALRNTVRWVERDIALLREQGASVNVIPDDAEALVAQCLEDYWNGLREGARTVYDETAAGQAHLVLKLVRSWLAPSATDPATHTDCRSEDGITVGLVDSIITSARVLKSRDLTGQATHEALEDLRQDEDVSALLSVAVPVPAYPEPLYAHNIWCALRKDGKACSCGAVPVDEPATPDEVVHEITLTTRGTYTTARCSNCGVIAGDHDLAWVQDKVDQHTADSLRPAPVRDDPSLTALRAKLRDECSATEGATGVDCHLAPGHDDWHHGTHIPRTDGTESIGYPFNIHWPRNQYDGPRVAPQASSTPTPKEN
jgi:hypothetical protein